MRGEISSGTFAKRHPLDWYVDEVWCARQLAGALGDFRRERDAGLAVWDPCCGMGNTIQAAWELGLPTHISDVVNNVVWDNFDGLESLTRPIWRSADFLEHTAAPVPCSIVCNPPYSYCKGAGEYARMLISEAFARHALKLATGRVCLLLPNKWLSSQARYALFMEEHPPLAVLHLTQRPSMPPGDRIHLMGNRAFRGGMIDYCWIVWDAARPTRPGFTRTVWLPPLAQPGKLQPVEGLA